MLCEYRSDNIDGLMFMERRFQAVFEDMRKFAEVEVELVGKRPCAKNLDELTQADLDKKCASILENLIGKPVIFNFTDV